MRMRRKGEVVKVEKSEWEGREDIKQVKGGERTHRNT